jgi:hypothetical protein
LSSPLYNFYRKSGWKVINEERRKLIIFCEAPDFENLNGKKVGDRNGKITLISKVQQECDTGGYTRIVSVRYSTIADLYMTEGRS